MSKANEWADHDALNAPPRIVGEMYWCEAREQLEHCVCQLNCICRTVLVTARPTLQYWERED